MDPLTESSSLGIPILRCFYIYIYIYCYFVNRVVLALFLFIAIYCSFRECIDLDGAHVSQMFEMGGNI